MQTNRTKARREALVELLRSGKYGGSAARGIILIPGNELSPNAYPANAYYFRQDSTFRYLFGIDKPALWGAIDLDNGAEALLFGDDTSLEDIIWTGPEPTLKEIALEQGIEPQNCRATAELQSLMQGRKVQILPPYRAETKMALQRLEVTQKSISAALIFATAELRERKSQYEIEQLEKAYLIGHEMHTRAMQLCRPGAIERTIGGTLEGIARANGNGVSFTPICTQNGQTLHNTEREGILQSGRLMLCDAGAETLSGYCSDHTRTYPINGRFTDIQREIYNLVLRAQEHVAAEAKPGVLYSQLQSRAYLTIAEGLQQMGFMKSGTGCSAEDIAQSGAMRIFMPHGVGHGLGLDVHDCEALGERSFDLSALDPVIVSNVESCIIRSQWRLQEGTVMTNEPGIYFIPELIERHRSEGKLRNIIDFEKVARHLDFGGIRIEDNLYITVQGASEIGAQSGLKIPKTVEELESVLS